MTSIRWSPQSVRDLEAIRDYIARDSERYALLVMQRLVAAVERIEVFPESGRIVPELEDPAIRELILPPYRLVYRLRGDVAEIVTVFRASRLLPSFE